MLIINGNLNKVGRIAEWSPQSILQYFDLHYAIVVGLENQYLVFFLSGCF